MQIKSARFCRVLLVCSLLLVLPVLTAAQTTGVPSRITQAVDEHNLTVLRGNTHPLARPEFDRGAAPASLPMERMLLVLKRSPDQEAALQILLDAQQDKSSPNYHAWLTPEQFGQQFGPSDQDIQVVTTWLESHGFQVAPVAKGRTVIEFSGNAAQVQEAFHTAIHKFVVNGEEHWANSTDPQIPAAVAPVVAGVKSLHNFLKSPQLVITDEKFIAKYTPGSRPEFTSSGQYALAPADYATIYNINPLYNSQVNGSGRTVAVVGRSNIIVQNVTDFRSVFGLPANNPQIKVNGPDPGDLGGAEEMEATLDTSWSGAVAPGATVILVVSASTNTTDGVYLSEVFIIDNNLGDVMTESFSGCEGGVTNAVATAISALAEQAAAQGITYMVSTGDSGAAGCDNPDTETVATQPNSVNVLASTPYTVAVGGTMFEEGSNASKYWSSTNNSTTLASALSYIPENVWNESCLSGCGQNGGGSIWAGGGGASIYFNKPVWQSGVTGIPPIATDPMRDLPDVSLTAAGHDPYLLCVLYSCENNGSGYISFYGVSGTSASAPSFAGVMALANQKTGSRQGQANYVLYRLAAQETLSQCNASSQSTLPLSTCMFNDVTVGNNAVPGEAGYGTSTAEYQSTTGYDLATGLGSVNVANLVNNWGNARSTVSLTSLTIPPGTLVHGSPISIDVSVAPKTGSGTPTGDVSLMTSTNVILPFATLDDTGSATATTNQLPGGSYTLTAHYEGDGTFLPSDSSPTPITISPEASSTALVVQALSTVGSCAPATTIPYSVEICLSATVVGSSGVGVPTGIVTFKDSDSTLDLSLPLDNTGSVSTYIAGSGTPSLNLAVGPHSIVANYNGDSSFQTSASSPFNFTVIKDPTTTTINIPSYPPLIMGQNSNMLISVSGNLGGSPTGTVTLFDGGTQIGSPAPVSSSGQGGTASIPFTPTVQGWHVLTANYSGDANYAASVSAATTAYVYYGTTTAISSSPATIQVGQSVTLTAQVASNQVGGPPITGSVHFVVNNITIATVPLTTGGQAQVTTSSLPGGTLTIWAYYSGDGNYAPSDGSVQEVVSFLGTTTTLTSSASTIQVGQNVIFTAQIAPVQPGGPVITGSVSFTANGSSIGSTPVFNNQAQTNTPSLPIGSLQIEASYSGDANYAPSSATLTETVTPPPAYSASANPTTITIASRGSTGSTVLTFAGINGFSGMISLGSTACVGMPSESGCSFGPSTVTLTPDKTGASNATSTLTISTTAPSTAMPRVFNYPNGVGWRILGVGLTLAVLYLMGFSTRHRRWSTISALILLAFLATTSGCGGGGAGGGVGGGGGGGGGNPGTPTGTYSVTLSITSGGIAPTSSPTLIVTIQ